MTDKIQIMIEAVMDKDVKQEFENEIRCIVRKVLREELELYQTKNITVNINNGDKKSGAELVDSMIKGLRKMGKLGDDEEFNIKKVDWNTIV